MSVPDMARPGVWTELFPAALKLMTHLESQTQNPLWTFGGGTVLMLRINHRLSKDIDLFVPDPQYLGYINPRLSDVAEQISTDYEEGAEVIRFYLPAGEIDIIVGSALTENPFDEVEHAGRAVRVETCVEIIAKKMWHRGDTGNRPLHSLRELYLAWHPGTSATPVQRAEILSSLAEATPEVTWQLLLELLPGTRSVSTQTHRPKWRQLGQVSRKSMKRMDVIDAYPLSASTTEGLLRGT